MNPNNNDAASRASLSDVGLGPTLVLSRLLPEKDIKALMDWRTAIIKAEREACVGAIKTLLDSHFAAAGDCDEGCDFVTAWETAIDELRKRSNVPGEALPHQKGKIVSDTPETNNADGGKSLSTAELERLCQLAKRSHYYCEDAWYSCPKAEDGCANDDRGPECDCGTDEHNAEVDALIAVLRSN